MKNKPLSDIDRKRILNKLNSPNGCISKKQLAKLAGVHFTTVSKWCKWAFPALERTGYKRRNRILTTKQFDIVWQIARHKYWLMHPWNIEKNTYPDKRPFNNSFLFPKIPK